MAARGIDRTEIQEALANVETTYASTDADDRVVVLGRTEGGRRLKVVVEAHDREAVITVADRDSEA